MKLTTGFDFQGYYITEYFDVIFDEMLVGLGFGRALLSGLDNVISSLTGNEATEMINKLNAVKQQLRDRVIAKARKLGANALIGIDFESSKLGDLIMVSMTATAVKIEKIASPLPCLESEQKRKEIERLEKEKAEERQRRMEAYNANSCEFDKVYFLEELDQFATTKDSVAFVEKIAEENPVLFDDALLNKVRGFANLERMYGKGIGKNELYNTIKTYLGL